MPRSISPALLAGLLLAGCGTAIPKAPPDQIDAVYDSVHGKGQRDTVELLQRGMRERQVYGTTQPYIPVRSNEDVRKIWVPDHVDPVTGRMVHGHWESTVLKEGSWYVEN